MTNDTNDLDDWFDKALADIEAAELSRRIRLENPWSLDLIKVLYPRGIRGLRRVDVLDRVEQLRKRRGLPMPKAFQETVQSAFQRYCVHSDVFKKSGLPLSDGIFLWPNGKGAGIWAVDVAKAETWIKEKQRQL